MSVAEPIRKWMAGLLLMLLCISMAPKAFFHDLVANHRDEQGCHQRHTTSVLHQQELNCHFDNLVVHVPFVRPPNPAYAFYSPSYCSYYTDYYVFHFPGVLKHSESRGPPVA